MDPYRTPPSPSAAEPLPASISECGLLWLMMAVGLLPFVGLAARGQWNESELGLATVLVLFAGRQLAREAGHRLRARRSRRERRERCERSSKEARPDE